MLMLVGDRAKIGFQMYFKCGETTDIGSEDVIVLECSIVKTSSVEECHGATAPFETTVFTVEKVSILGIEVDLALLPSELLKKMAARAAEYLL